MIVGALTIQMHLRGIESLKDKRSIVKSLLGRLKSRFNVSAAEVDHLDSKVLGVIGVSVVSNEGTFVNQVLDSVINFAHNDGRFFVARIDRETFTFPE